ncbi:glycosyltransferase family 90 protein [Piedraia hortae CBS 480.64]|uniref:Glycosyltransferase family 90 protein n=1 Tax=Piedraia hortae CBS 480.64 TaxID=1314780 RepID=A0A6A7BSJ7_9PEZI|nr:glycosyltransferase family 90 protein [Piedraia hortae CBS 480.64]
MPSSHSLPRFSSNGVPALVSSYPALPLVLFLLLVLGNLDSGWGHHHHALLSTSVSWALICAFAASRAGWREPTKASECKRLAWVSGALWAFAAVEQRSAGDGGKSLWWAKTLLPLAVLTVGWLSASNGSDEAQDAPLLLVISASAVAAVYLATGSAAVSAGLADAAFLAMAFVLTERATKLDGAFETAVLRDISAVASAATAMAALALEPSVFTDMKLSQDGMLLPCILGLAMVSIRAVASWSLLTMVQVHGALISTLVPLHAAVLSRLIVDFSPGRLWSAGIGAISTIFLLNNARFGGTMNARFRKLLLLVAAASMGVMVLVNWQYKFRPSPVSAKPFTGTDSLSSEHHGALYWNNTRVHPIDQLVRDAEAQWLVTLQKQSRSLDAAVAEYRRRYRLSPPPNFDKWFQFAANKNVQLVDEYDTIFHSLLPFWALSPATIRARTREALGFGGNNLMAVLIRGGRVFHVEGGQAWLQDAIEGMLGSFVEHLPDMDLAFNIHDEPRVVVPHDDLNRLVHTALNVNIPAAVANKVVQDQFSKRPADVKDSRRIKEAKTTRFNSFAHQPTWIPSRLSCAPDSPSRCLGDEECHDNRTAYEFSELGFIYNHTAFTDVCQSPSLATSHGFFDRPNAFNVVHDLFPIFSQSKISSFQDIVYPSPWYWYGKVDYDSKKDEDWTTKAAHLWWRGSTTGGFSRNGGWRRQHRQKIVSKLNSLGKAKILVDKNRDHDSDGVPSWQIKEVDRPDYKEAMDVHFSHVGQCDPGDCQAQQEFFTIAPAVEQQDAWKHRFLLDVDGNAFSGRFYAFLRSKSLTFKFAIFREWHEEWLKPWVHYIPLSLRAEEALESVRYLISEPEGKKQAVRMAQASTDWAKKALRKEDFEAWLFRLLLEYGRLVDDNREGIKAY